MTTERYNVTMQDSDASHVGAGHSGSGNSVLDSVAAWVALFAGDAQRGVIAGASCVGVGDPSSRLADTCTSRATRVAGSAECRAFSGCAHAELGDSNSRVADTIATRFARNPQHAQLSTGLGQDAHVCACDVIRY